MVYQIDCLRIVKQRSQLQCVQPDPPRDHQNRRPPPVLVIRLANHRIRVPPRRHRVKAAELLPVSFILLAIFNSFSKISSSKRAYFFARSNGICFW